MKDRVTIKRQELLKAGFPATTVGKLERLGILSFDYRGPNGAHIYKIHHEKMAHDAPVQVNKVTF
ncbi:MAG: hypothetical protein PXY39_12625 [archaeon]|nr:hypothetical protein [archaeon]